MNLRRRGLLLSSIMLPILLLVMCIHWGEGYRIHNKKVRSGLTDYMVHSDLRLPANHYQSWARQSRHSMTYEAQRMDIKGINAVVFKSPSHRPRSQLFGSQRKGNATYSRRSKLRARVAFMVDRVRRFLAKMKYFLSCLWQYIMALREFFRPLNQTEWREFIQPPQKQNFEKYRVSILDSEGDLYDLVSNNEEDSPIEVGFRQLDKKGRDRLYVETRLKEIDDLMKNAQQKAAKKVVNKKRDRLYIESRLKEIDAMLNRTETAAEDKDAVAAPESTPVSATNANSTAATTPSSAHAERAYSSQEESTQVYWPPGIKTRITMEQTREYGPLSYSIPLATPATGNTSSVDAAGQSNNRTFVGDRFPTFEWSAPYSTNWMQRNEDGDELLKLDFFEGKWRLSEKRQNDSKYIRMTIYEY